MHRVSGLERVAKTFYTRFKAEHERFLLSIEGITRKVDRERYASLLLLRLMFVYFLQKKGLLDATGVDSFDGDRDYLSSRLRMMQGQEACFASFYRSFLLRFFYEGLGSSRRSEELETLLGRVPYLGEGLFEVHELERMYADIHIPDQAFGTIFAFFDKFAWHLDNHPLQSAWEMNPDVMGALFEKYSNQQEKGQKEVGAYYTGEDITGYICQNVLVPFLLETFEQRCPAALQRAWSLLTKNPDRYIYQALKTGCALPLPPGIEAASASSLTGECLNELATGAYALSQETWREVILRRRRYTSLKARLSGREISTVNDLITCNLDIRQFALDMIENCREADVLLAFYEGLEQMAVLDPTCGSGAFLFAALAILEPLYTACLERMQAMMELNDCVNCPSPALPALYSQTEKEPFQHLQEILRRVAGYPSCQYFIYQSMVRSNLYGVDIMPEAVEVCKLRLFLALVARIERFADLEQFANIDFHLRVGNALADFTALNEARGLCEHDPSSHPEYWRAGQTFHWCVDFREIISRGGFEVIIGNPPYVAYARVKKAYEVQGYQTQACGNLYAYVLELAMRLLRQGGRCGMIVPVSAIAAENYRPLSELLLQRQIWISSYANRPGKLFARVEQRLAILLVRDAAPAALFTTSYRHWYEREREHLFATLAYAPASVWWRTGMPLKSGSELAERIFARMSYCHFACFKGEMQSWLNNWAPEHRRAQVAVWVHDGPTYWVRALPFAPNVGQRGRHSNHYLKVPTRSQDEAFALAAILSSSTFYLFYKLVSNCRDLGQKELHFFPLGELRPALKQRLVHLGSHLAARLRETASKCTRQYPGGLIEYEEYYPARAKAIIDEIDRVLAEHYGFTAEELDFLLNYEIKYRMSQYPQAFQHPQAGRDAVSARPLLS